MLVTYAELHHSFDTCIIKDETGYILKHVAGVRLMLLNETVPYLQWDSFILMGV